MSIKEQLRKSIRRAEEKARRRRFLRASEKLRAGVSRERRARRRQYSRNQNRLHRKKLKAAGYVEFSSWIKRDVYMAARARAQMLGIPARVMCQAAIDTGLRFIRTSELIQAARIWRMVCGEPLSNRGSVAIRTAAAKKALAERKAKYGIAFIKRQSRKNVA